MRFLRVLLLLISISFFIIACGSSGGGGDSSGNTNGGGNDDGGGNPGIISCPSSTSLLNTWAQRTSGTTNNLNDIVYANNTFIAVGDNGTIVSSTDGTTWTQRTSGTTNNLNGISYQNSIFFAFGDNGLFLTSTDGITWQTKTTDPQPLYDIFYTNNFYLLAGYDYIAKSTDLSNWTKGSGYPNPPGAYTIAYGNTLFTYSGERGDIYTSSDGLNWTKRQDNGCYIGKIIYINSKFYAVGCLSSPAFGSVGYISNDGITWSEINDLKEGNIIYSDIASCDSNLVAVGSYGNLKISTDGTTWTSGTTGDNSSWAYSVAFGNNTLVVVGDNGTILQLQ